MSRDRPLFLADIIEHGERVERLVRGQDLDRFERDEVLRQAILFSLLIIGEATKQLPQSLRDAEPTVNWRGAAGLRDIIVHSDACNRNCSTMLMNDDILEILSRVCRAYRIRKRSLCMPISTLTSRRSPIGSCTTPEAEARRLPHGLSGWGGD